VGARRGAASSQSARPRDDNQRDPAPGAPLAHPLESGQPRPRPARAAAAARRASAADPALPTPHHPLHATSQVTDNSGAKVAQCINQAGRAWTIGDVITVSVKRAQPRSKVAAGQVGGVWAGLVCGRLASTRPRGGAPRHAARPSRLLTPSSPSSPGPQGRHHGDRERDPPRGRHHPALCAQRVRPPQRQARPPGHPRARLCHARAARARACQGAVPRGARAVKGGERTKSVFCSAAFPPSMPPQPRLTRDTLTLAVFGVLAAGTAAALVLTSQAKKAATAAARAGAPPVPPGFE